VSAPNAHQRSAHVSLLAVLRVGDLSHVLMLVNLAGGLRQWSLNKIFS
jgi:hypothetical protein